MKEIKRGEIYAVDFGAGFGSEQGGIRPSLILQNDIGNRHSPTTIVAAITGRKTKAALPTHVKIMAKGLKTESTVLLEQIRTIDKARLGEYIGRLDSKTLAAVDSMDKRTDINTASFAYSVSLLRMLLDMNLITEDEYEKIAQISAQHYGAALIYV